MSEIFAVRIVPSGKHGDTLTVEDAFNQILDVFTLLDRDTGDSGQIEWRLVNVQMNSPLQVVAEAVARKEGVAVSEIARV